MSKRKAGASVAAAVPAPLSVAVATILAHADRSAADVIAACETLRQQTQLTDEAAAYAWRKGCPRALLDAIRGRLEHGRMCAAALDGLTACFGGFAAALKSGAAPVSFVWKQLDGVLLGRVMQEHIANATLVERACAIAGYVTADVSQVKHQIENGIEQQLVAVFKRHVLTAEAVAATGIAATPKECDLETMFYQRSVPIARLAVRLALHFSTAAEGCKALLDVGMLPVLFQSLRLHKSDAFCTQHTLWALINLRSKATDDVIGWPVSAEWMEIVAEAMLQHAHDAVFVSDACSLLQLLGRFSEVGPAEIPASVVTAIVDMLGRHPQPMSSGGAGSSTPALVGHSGGSPHQEDSSVALFATAALSNMSPRIPVPQRLLVANTVLRAGIRALAISESSGRPSQIPASVSGVLCFVLRRPIAPRSDVLPLADVVRFLIDTANYEVSSDRVGYWVCKTLRLIASASEEGMELTQRVGAPELASGILALHQMLGAIAPVSAACKLIRVFALAREEFAVRMCVKRPVTPAGPPGAGECTALMLAKAGAPARTVELAGLAFAALAQYESCRRVIREAGVDKRVIELLDGAGTLPLPNVVAACLALRCLAESTTAGAREALLVANLPRRLLVPLRRKAEDSSPRLRELCCGVIRNLAGAGAPGLRRDLVAAGSGISLLTVLRRELGPPSASPAAGTASAGASAKAAAGGSGASAAAAASLDADVAWPALGGLYLLACELANCQALQDAGAGSSASRALQMPHHGGESISLRWTAGERCADWRVAWAACGVLLKLAQSAAAAESHAHTSRSASTTSHAAAAVAAAAASDSAAAPAAAAAGATPSSPSRLRLLHDSDGAGRALIDALRLHSANPRVARAASAALTALAVDSAVQGELLRLGAREAITAAGDSRGFDGPV